MGLESFGITTGHESYIALRAMYPGGINWIRKNIGQPVNLQDGIPEVFKSQNLNPNSVPLILPYRSSIIDDLIGRKLADAHLGQKREHFFEHDKNILFPITSQGEAIAYSIGISCLVHPWGEMLTTPYRDLNREICRFASRYDSPDYNPLTESEKFLLLLIKKVKEIIEAREEKIKEEIKFQKK